MSRREEDFGSDSSKGATTMTSTTVSNHHTVDGSTCTRHQFDRAVDRCRTCHNPYCSECLLYAFGESQPPFCMTCAIAAAGVRTRGTRTPKVSWRELRRREKAAKESAQRAKMPPPPSAEIDWSVPDSADGAGNTLRPEESLSWLEAQDSSDQPGEIIRF